MKRGVRVPTSDPHTINACWSLFLLSVYLVVAEAASFDKKRAMQERYRHIKKNKEGGMKKKNIFSVSDV